MIQSTHTIHNSPYHRLVEELFLRENSLSGTLPSSLSSLSKLQRLQVTWNNLVGTIPPLSGLDSLIVLGVGRNSLTGPIPEDIGDLRSLSKLIRCSSD